MQFGQFVGHRRSYLLLTFVLKGLLVTLAGFSLFRLLLFILNFEHVRSVASPLLVFESLFKGIQGDLLAAGVLFWLPLVLAVVQPVIHRGSKVFLVAGLIGTGIVMQLALTVSSLDIPFFQHFFSRLSDMILNWKDQPEFLIRMVTQEARFWWFIGLFLLLSVLIWWWILRRLPAFVRSIPQNGREKAGISVTLVVLLLLLSLLLRNRLHRKHYFAMPENGIVLSPMLEKISQNPLLSLSYSLTSRPLSELLKESMGLSEALSELSGALTRDIDLARTEPMEQIVSGAISPRRMNVVLVLMESINNERFNSGLMPQLEKTAAAGLKWTRFYGSGVHTYAGIYATLCGFPVQLRQHAMKWESAKPYYGLGTILERNGYQTYFYTTHDDRFDNMGPFLKDNGFSRIVSLDQYGRGKALSTFGVPDHIMFDHALEDLDDEGGKRPFLAVLLSSSNHAPYRFPAGIPFIAKSRSLPRRMIEYSDWALGRFTAGAKEKDWAKRTLFVFVGDHGANGDVRFSLPYSMVHIPLIMTGPGISPGETVQGLGSQLDIMPTIMGRLGLEYRNLSFGIDLFRSERSLAVFCSDEYLGCTDGDFFLAFNFDRTGTFGYIGEELNLQHAKYKEKREEMMASALSFWKVADWLLAEKRHYQPSLH